MSDKLTGAMLRSVAAILLLALVAEAHTMVANHVAVDKDSMNKFADEVFEKYVNRALKPMKMQHADLDAATFGKPGTSRLSSKYLASQQRLSALVNIRVLSYGHETLWQGPFGPFAPHTTLNTGVLRSHHSIFQTTSALATSAEAKPSSVIHERNMSIGQGLEEQQGSPANSPSPATSVIDLTKKAMLRNTSAVPAQPQAAASATKGWHKRLCDKLEDPGPKSVERIMDKVTLKYAGRYERNTDYCRLGLVYSSVGSMLNAVKTFFEFSVDEHGMQVVRIDNRFSEPSRLGWRDLTLLIKVEVPSSRRFHIAELQLELEALSEVRDTTHAFYKNFRSILPETAGNPLQLLPETAGNPLQSYADWSLLRFAEQVQEAQRTHANAMRTYEATELQHCKRLCAMSSARMYLVDSEERLLTSKTAYMLGAKEMDLVQESDDLETLMAEAKELQQHLKSFIWPECSNLSRSN